MNDAMDAFEENPLELEWFKRKISNVNKRLKFENAMRRMQRKVHAQNIKNFIS